MENLQNVYETPKANVVIDSDPGVEALADRKTRFVAAIVDGIIGLIIGLPFMFIAGPYLGYEEIGQQPSFNYLLAATLFGLIAFLIIHGYYLQKFGQTIGKRVLKIKIVSMSGDKPTLTKLFGLRYLPISLATLVPIAGSFLPVIDVLFIFRKDRRCVHDFIAGTKVVKVSN